MSERLPRDVEPESWVERIILQAMEEGHFDDLEGRGQPLPDLDRPYDPAWWVKRWLARNDLSVLPRELELRRKVERVLERIRAERSEMRVREILRGLNDEIRAHNASVTGGPPTALGPVDIERVLEAWRGRRQEPHPRMGDVAGAES